MLLCLYISTLPIIAMHIVLLCVLCGAFMSAYNGRHHSMIVAYFMPKHFTLNNAVNTHVFILGKLNQRLIVRAQNFIISCQLWYYKPLLLDCRCPVEYIAILSPNLYFCFCCFRMFFFCSSRSSSLFICYNFIFAQLISIQSVMSLHRTERYLHSTTSGQQSPLNIF